MALGNEIFGRPALLDIQGRVQSNTSTYVATAILRASALLQLLTFDTTRDLTKVYKRQQLARVGQLRGLNTDYAPKFAGGETQITTNLAILGDAYEWDRVLGAVDPAQIDAQIEAMAPGIGNRYSDLLVNGSRTANGLEFDGLSVLAEAIGGNSVVTGLDLTISDTGNNLVFRRNYAKLTKAIRQMVALGLKPVVIGNTDVQNAIDLAGELVAANTISDYFNRQQVTTIAGAAMIDSGMANIYGTPTTVNGRQVYPVEQREVIPSDTTSGVVTDIYVVGIGVGGVTGLTLDGFDARSPVRFSTARTDAGAVRRAEMEIVAGAAVVDERAVVKFSDAKVG
ncbi:hypothetical protein [Deinococcus aquatilis]|uniref:hypothetical protein n=1 Tax=Deinococcus aquatilis TaxID=519440 RepID=UPI000369958B|nr:hypothetical protein [Deinococcus aquatilis]